ncbi:signal peptidase I [Amorphus sp. MBR-141]
MLQLLTSALPLLGHWCKASRGTPDRTSPGGRPNDPNCGNAPRRRALRHGCTAIGLALLASLTAAPPSVSASACRPGHVRVAGKSLEPRIADGVILLAALGPGCRSGLERGAVVLVRVGASRQPLAKAVVGRAGDPFRIAPHGAVIVNGAPARNAAGEPYRLSKARAEMLALYARAYNGRIPDGALLVMGEVPSGSRDSSWFGLISVDAVVGIVLDDTDRSGRLSTRQPSFPDIPHKGEDPLPPKGNPYADTSTSTRP